MSLSKDSVEVIEHAGQRYRKVVNLDDKRSPKHLIIAVDHSGSMGDECSNSENNGFTRLDLVKHSLRTTYLSMEESDMLTLVMFSTNARVAFSGAVSKQNVPVIERHINDLTPDASTNIWEALNVCLQEASKEKERQTSALILTDGRPTASLDSTMIMSAYRGQLGAYRHIPITTVGYGYDTDVGMLSGLAEESSGRYLFIPDVTMVGTVFANYLANVLNDTPSGVKVGHFMIQREYMADVPARPANEEETTMIAVFKFAEFVRCLLSPESSKINLAEMQSHFADYPFLAHEIDHPDPHKGQISKARMPDNYRRWGFAYLSMLANAHKLQECCNFKDLSVQKYGGPKFRETLDRVQQIYVSIPAPKPSRYTRNQVASMATYYDSSSGCFNGKAPVQVLRSIKGAIRKKPTTVDDLSVGDYVETGVEDEFAEVLCVVYRSAKNVFAYNVGRTYITAWHPIIADGRWCFPCEVYPAKDLVPYPEDGYYNLVLKTHHSIRLGGVLAITLGHNILGDPVATHDYFGRGIIHDLEQMPGWEKGFVDLSGFAAVRDEATSRICGFVPQQ